ncbi:MAG: hypothetical protein ABEK12_02555 [Candidatus Nanohaloarchaea archaeon]
MSDDPVDYEEVVSENIDTVKERVESEDLDVEEVLAAEQANKNRVTLVEWLEQQVAEQTAEDIAETAAEQRDDPDSPAASADSGGVVGRMLDAVTSTFFLGGLVVGVLATAAVFTGGLAPTGGGGAGAVTPAQAGDQVETYLSNNSAALGFSDVTVNDVSAVSGANLYEVSLTVARTARNRTVRQNGTIVTTTNANYLFLSQPIRTDQPLLPQVQPTWRTVLFFLPAQSPGYLYHGP